MHTDYYFSFKMLLPEKNFWTRIAGMEGLEEYADGGFPLNEQSNS